MCMCVFQSAVWVSVGVRREHWILWDWSYNSCVKSGWNSEWMYIIDIGITIHTSVKASSVPHNEWCKDNLSIRLMNGLKGWCGMCVNSGIIYNSDKTKHEIVPLQQCKIILSGQREADTKQCHSKVKLQVEQNENLVTLYQISARCEE